MKTQFKMILNVLFLSILITACSSSEESSNHKNFKSIIGNAIPTDNNTLSTTASGLLDSNKVVKDSEISGKIIHNISVLKIASILSAKNKDVIETLLLSDSKRIKSTNGELFYVPVFQCEELGVLVGFNGASFDSIGKIKEKDETPIFIKPEKNTIIGFEQNLNFRVGDDLKEFKLKFGDGVASLEGNLKGDKEFNVLKYTLNNLIFSFRSLKGDDFKEYEIIIEKMPDNPSNKPSNDSRIQQTEGSSPIKDYKAVLNNQVDFFSTEGKKSVYLDDFLKGGFNGYDMTVGRFAVIDMDGDKIPEVILELCISKNPQLFEILHYNNGKVYGYNIVLRGLLSLKKDGTSWASGGASDNRCRKLRFFPNNYEEDIIGYSESSYKNNSLEVSYFIENRSVSPAEFDSFRNKQYAKEDVAWYNFSNRNIDMESFKDQ